MTALRCGNCHRVAGEATTDADIETSVIVDRRFQDDKGWWSSRGDTWGIFVADIEKHADAWPLRWPCPHCGATVALGREAARRVGRRRNVWVHTTT